MIRMVLGLIGALSCFIFCSCSDSSRPTPIVDNRVPEYHAEWEMDVWSFVVDNGGNLHVAQFSEPDLLKYSGDGQLIDRWFVVDNQDTLDVASLTYVAGKFVTLAWSRVVVLDQNHTVVASWPEKYFRSFTFGGDLIDADNAGHLYVLDDNRDLIVKYALDGTFLREWNVGEVDSLGYGGLAGIAVTDGAVCVADYWRDRILVYNRDGTFLRKFGKTGSQRDQLDGPRGLDISNGVLYVADNANFRVKKFSLFGAYLSDFYSQGTHGQGLDGPEAVAVYGNSVFVMHENSIMRFEYID